MRRTETELSWCFSGKKGQCFLQRFTTRAGFVVACNPCLIPAANVKRCLIFSLREMRVKGDLDYFIAILAISVDPVWYLAIYHMLAAEMFSSFLNHNKLFSCCDSVNWFFTKVLNFIVFMTLLDARESNPPNWGFRCKILTNSLLDLIHLLTEYSMFLFLMVLS